MKNSFIPFLGTILVAVLVGCDRQSVDVDAFPITVSDIPLVFNEVAGQKIEKGFAAFLHEVDGGKLNLQFSYENGKAGFDWVLLAPQNISDEELFRNFAQSLNYKIKEKEINGVRYLRIDDDEDLPQLAYPDGKGGFNKMPRDRACRIFV